MRTIVKRSEPPALRAHRETPHGDYDNYPEKDRLRKALVDEQRGLCCYCMAGISDARDRMKIEHWRSRARYPGEQLDYPNLLGACLGGGSGRGERRRRRDLHCDTHKADRDLRWNPADPDHRVEARLRYEADGTIRADDADFDDQLDTVLNLNLPLLKNNRKSVLDAMLTWWRVRAEPAPGSRLEIEVRRRTAGDGLLQPYVQVAVWWLEKRIARTRS